MPIHDLSTPARAAAPVGLRSEARLPCAGFLGAGFLGAGFLGAGFLRAGFFGAGRLATALVGVLALGLAGACSSSPSSAQSPEDMDPEQKFALFKETALFHYDNDDMFRAESQALKALEIEPEDKDLKLLVGWAAMRRGTPEDMIHAHGIFSTLEESEDYRAWLGFATAKERLGQGYEEAADDFEAGERILEDEDADVPALVVELREKAEVHWAEAVELYERVLAERPDERLAINGMQRVFLHRGDNAKALEWSDRLLAQTEVELEFFRAQLRREDLTVEEEDRLRRNEAELLDLSIKTADLAATALRQLDRRSEAIVYLDRVLEIEPDQTRALAFRGQLKTEEGRWAEARDDLDRFLAVSDLDHNHPAMKRAFELREECLNGLRRGTDGNP